MAIFTGVLSSKPVEYEEEKREDMPAADFVIADSDAVSVVGAEQEEFVARGLH
jgi:hypothetical protein